MLYIIASLNIVLPVIISYLCLKINKKYGYFYAFVFTLLMLGIISHFTMAMEFFVGKLFPFDGRTKILELLKKIIDYTIVLIFPAFLSAFYPIIHIIPIFMSLLMIGTQERKFGKKQVIIIVLLNVLYLLFAYGSYRTVCSLFAQ
ncbi:MAG: hypothetical protein J6A07_03490 [Firmicutes bacterium]|nr:hypothetical protein [Bacillota bacterium]